MLNFFKTDLNGDDTTVQPVFCSNNVYLNSVTEFVTEDVLKASLPTIKERFDDFVSKGSGKEIFLPLGYGHSIRGGIALFILGSRYSHTL